MAGRWSSSPTRAPAWTTRPRRPTSPRSSKPWRAARDGRSSTAPTRTRRGLEISRTIARHLGHAWEEVLLGDSAPAGLGRHPWDRWPPVVLDMTAAAQLGYQPAGDYAATVAATVDWLVAGARGGPDAGLLPTPADEYFARYLDYPAEDRYLAGE